MDINEVEPIDMSALTPQQRDFVAVGSKKRKDIEKIMTYVRFFSSFRDYQEEALKLQEALMVIYIAWLESDVFMTQAHPPQVIAEVFAMRIRLNESTSRVFSDALAFIREHQIKN